jgi:hypothetical protein
MDQIKELYEDIDRIQLLVGRRVMLMTTIDRMILYIINTILTVGEFEYGDDVALKLMLGPKIELLNKLLRKTFSGREGKIGQIITDLKKVNEQRSLVAHGDFRFTVGEDVDIEINGQMKKFSLEKIESENEAAGRMREQLIAFWNDMALPNHKKFDNPLVFNAMFEIEKDGRLTKL